MYVCRFAHRGDTFPLRTTSLLEGSSSLQEAYTKACPNSAKKINAACWCLMTHKYRGSIVVLSISKSVEPNEEQKEMISGFQQGTLCKY